MDFGSYQTGKYYRDFRGMNGSKLYEENGKLYLVISYDDILDEEIDAFWHGSLEVTFKTLGLVSIFTFKFAGRFIVDAPFNQFAKDDMFVKETYEDDGQISMDVLIFESSNGMFLGQRNCALPAEFSAKLAKLVESRYAEYAGKYNFQAFNQGIKSIYDNHIIEELYELPGDHEICCFCTSAANLC